MIPEIKYLNINYIGLTKKAIWRCFTRLYSKKKALYTLFSVISCGIYTYFFYKKAKEKIKQAISYRKNIYFDDLFSIIEDERKKCTGSDPRKMINSIFLKVQSKKVGKDEKDLEFKAIYTPTEILLFITNPIREKKMIRLHRLKSHSLDYYKIWKDLKKKAWINQFRQIKNINFCFKTLKQEFFLNEDDIQDRLKRSTAYRKNPNTLTRLKELHKAFQEIIIAYQDFEEMSESNPDFYNLVALLTEVSKKDLEILQNFLASRYLPQDLPLKNRRQLIQFGNKQDILYNMSKEERFDICALICNDYQWNFLLSIQEVSQITINLINWAFETVPKEIKPPSTFIEKISKNIQMKVKAHKKKFPILNQAILKDPSLGLMTVEFGRELHREFSSLNLFRSAQLIFSHSKVDSLNLEDLISIYHALKDFSEDDLPLFSLLQQAVSQKGKNSFYSFIESGLEELLGEKSQYLIPVLSNSDLSITKKSPSDILMNYSFDQVITKKGQSKRSYYNEKYIVISQSLLKNQNRWESPKPEVTILDKNQKE